MHDSHIHLALNPLNTDIDGVVERFKKAGGKNILTQGTDLADFDDSISFCKKYPDTISCALGLHPGFFQEFLVERGELNNLFEKSQEYISHFQEYIQNNILYISGIGETGLDYYQFNMFEGMAEDIKEQLKEIQKISFKKHIQLAMQYNLPLSIHARDRMGDDDCVKDTLRILAEEGRGTVKGSFHSYTGETKYVEDILGLGLNIGFNAIITYKSGENVRDNLRKTPVEKILFETDGPFLPTDSIRKDPKIKNKFAEPFQIKEIIATASEILNISNTELERVTDDNYMNTFPPRHAQN